jgi:NADH dehydrogenase [ubiquinone] 1 alpha subcomplex assembly factor 1
MIKYKLLAAFGSANDEKRWDLVQYEGGVPAIKCKFVPATANTVLFEGELSSDRDRGCASVRTRIGDLLLDGFRGIAMRARGDGRCYRFFLGTERAAYEATFETQNNAWVTIYLPFNKFEPLSHGNTVSATFLDPADIRQMGITISDKVPGPFKLEIDWIKAYLDY